MPQKPVSKKLKQKIAALNNQLKKDYGCDYSFQIYTRGFVLAKTNIEATVVPITKN